MWMETPAGTPALAPWVPGYEPGHNGVVLVTLDRGQGPSAATGPTVMLLSDELDPDLEGAVRDTGDGSSTSSTASR